jgi:ribosome biogenesis GTPase / thiamine phosphate phosphatase
MAKKKRVDFRKNLSKPPRVNDLTSGFREHGFEEEAPKSGERVRSKGDQSRKRTINVDETGQGSMPAVDLVNCVPGRIIRCHGLDNVVHLDDGRILRCKVRRLLKSLSIDERSIVTTGDRVWVRPSLNDQGFIERVEPRHGLLTRASRGREHVLVANVDQVAIVIALVEPELKPHLIDRYIASAEQGKIKPILCLNKVDLVDPAEFQPIVGYYSQLGVPTILTSATTGVGIDRLRRLLKGRQSVFSGQSGVGKSSLLNAVQPGLGLQVRTVSDVNQKGRHTTTTTQLLELELGGWVVDTPGIRTFDLWNIIAEQVEGLFAEFRPFVTLCGFPDCTHTHEQRCAVKKAVEDRRISERRYLSYLGIYDGKMEDRADED